MHRLDNERWQVGDLTIDVGRQMVHRRGVPIILPPLSFRFLMALVRAAPRLISTGELMSVVWAGVFVSTETVIQRAKLLRDALGEDASKPRYFSVRRGAGYQLIAQPVRLEPAESPRGGGVRRRALAGGALSLFLAVGPSSMRQPPSVADSAGDGTLRVAVLPFENLSRDTSDAFIAQSIAEMVLDRLSSVPGLTVIARDSALLSPAATAPAGEAAQQLHVTYIVRGSVQRAGDTLRVTCFVLDTARRARIWSERFDWPVARIYALQDHIAEGVAAVLEDQVRAIGPLPAQARVASSSEAYLAYLKGKSLLSRFTVAETDAAAAQFERAVRLDPGFPDAMVALFDARMQGASLRLDDLAPFRARYEPLLDRAMRIDPDAGPALFAKAMWSNQPFEARNQLFRRAAQRDPSNSRGLTAYAEFLDRLGADARVGTWKYAPEAEALIDRVLAVDPLSRRARWWSVSRTWMSIPPVQLERKLAREHADDPENYTLAVTYARTRWYVLGETAEAIAATERAIASDPQQPLAPNMAVALYLDVEDPHAAAAVAATTAATRASSRILLAQYRGDWEAAGAAALALRRFPFNIYQTWNWAEALRDHALRTGQHDKAARAIGARHGIDLSNPRALGPPQIVVAGPLAHVLMASGEGAKAARFLSQTVQWIDAHPTYGMPYHMRVRAMAMMLLAERDEALSNLRAAFETGHDVRHWWYVVEHDPVWTPARADPRFKAIAVICRRLARFECDKLDLLRRTGRAPARAST